eukprot:2175431-Amphidinium_carterae.1
MLSSEGETGNSFKCLRRRTAKKGQKGAKPGAQRRKAKKTQISSLGNIEVNPMLSQVSISSKTLPRESVGIATAQGNIIREEQIMKARISMQQVSTG